MAKNIEEQMTGCIGAGDYAEWAKQNGYPFCLVVDWTSSAGNWTFLVSTDGWEWYLMSQENNYPRQGFTRTVDDTFPFFGDSEEAMRDACNFLEEL